MKLLMNTANTVGDTRISYPNNIFIIFNLGLSARIYIRILALLVYYGVCCALHNHNNITATTTPLNLDPIAWRLNSAMDRMDIGIGGLNWAKKNWGTKMGYTC